LCVVENVQQKAESECVDENRRRPNVDNFITSFEADKRTVSAIHETAAAAVTAGGAIDVAALSQASDLLQRMQDLLSQSIMDLPPYEIRSAQNCLTEFTQKNTQLRESAAPKKKFAFKSRSKVTAATDGPADALASSESKSENVAAVSSSSSSATAAALLSRYESQAVKLHDLNGARLHYTPGQMSGKDMWISHATETSITICDHVGAMRIDHVKNCLIMVGAVAGSVHLEHCDDCVFILASRQIRIHTANKCTFYLVVQSNPIIEHSNAVQFAPYSVSYAQQGAHARAAQLDLTRNLWSEVNDFNWLKNEQQSPNWSIVPPAERRPMMDIDPLTGNMTEQTARVVMPTSVAPVSAPSTASAASPSAELDEEF
jgi:hypothetical protein